MSAQGVRAPDIGEHDPRWGCVAAVCVLPGPRWPEGKGLIQFVEVEREIFFCKDTKA